MIFPTCVTYRRGKGTRRQWTYSGCNLVTIVRWQMGPGDLARLGSGSGRHISSCDTCAGRYVLQFCDSFEFRFSYPYCMSMENKATRKYKNENIYIILNLSPLSLSAWACDGQEVTADSRILIDLVCGSEIAPVSTKSLSLSLLLWTSSPSSHSLRNIHECARDYLNANTSDSFYHQVEPNTFTGRQRKLKDGFKCI